MTRRSHPRRTATTLAAAFTATAAAATIMACASVGPAGASSPTADQGAVVNRGAIARAPMPGDNAPTADLAKIANAVDVRVKSVTARVAIAGGLTLDHPVEVSISFSGQRVTQTYVSRSDGLRYLHNFGDNGGRGRTEFIDISLREEVSPGHWATFALSRNPAIVPLYNVTISPLDFQLIHGCAAFGDNDIELSWRDDGVPAGSGKADFTLGDGGVFHVGWFGATIIEAPFPNGIPLRTLDVAELSFEWGNLTGFAGPTAIVDAPLAPGTSATKSHDVWFGTDDCLGHVTYSVNSQLQWYPFL